MFRPKKTIPTLVVGALALFGCGDDTPGETGGTSGAGGSGGSAGSGGAGGMAGTGGSAGVGGNIGAELAASLDAWCMNIAGCPDVDITKDYCVYAYSAELSQVDAACRDGAQSYFDCSKLLSCDDIGPDNSCDALRLAFVACIDAE